MLEEGAKILHASIVNKEPLARTVIPDTVALTARDPIFAYAARHPPPRAGVPGTSPKGGTYRNLNRDDAQVAKDARI